MKWRAAAVSALDVVDPGAVRRRHAGRSGLAGVSAWLTMRLVARAFDEPVTEAVLFSVMITLVGALSIADPRRSARLVTIAVAGSASLLAILTASAIGDREAIAFAVLLALMFTSFAARRYGMRAGEVALMGTMAFYFAQSAGVGATNLEWFLLAAVVGLGWLTIWQFVLVPFHPQKSIEAAASSFYRRAGELVNSISDRLRSTDDRTTDFEHIQRQLERVKVTRGVIESQFFGVLEPGGNDAHRLEQLQLALYSTEQGLAGMVDATVDTAWLRGIEPELIGAAIETLDALGAALVAGASPDAVNTMAQRTHELRERIGATGETRSWEPAAVALARSAQHVARSVAEARTLVLATTNRATTKDRHDAPPAEPSAEHAPQPAQHPVAPSMPTGLHPTVALGIQAAVACAIGWLVAHLLGLDHPNWTFWTAFIVVAGSAGESIRRMFLRVLATAAGATTGVLISLLLPDRVELVALTATIGGFLAIYESSVSYTKMVFWVNVAFVPIYTQIGGNEFELLRQRPIAVAIGGVVGATVTLTVLPVKVTDRVRGTLAAHLAAIDNASAAWVRAFGDPSLRSTADLAMTRADATYAALRRGVDASAFESNPFPGAPSTLAAPAVKLGAVDAALQRLALAAPDEIQGPSRNIGTIAGIGDAIHVDLVRFGAALDAQRSAVRRPLRQPVQRLRSDAGPLQARATTSTLANALPVGRVDPDVAAFAALGRTIELLFEPTPGHFSQTS